MTPDWHKIGIVSKNDFDLLEQKMDTFISNQEKLLKAVADLEKKVSKELKEQKTKTITLQKTVDEIKSEELQMIQQEIQHIDQLVKLSLVNNLVSDMEKK